VTASRLNQEATGRSQTAIEIVTIGDELLLGFTIDTNAARLARALASIGMHIVRRSTSGDDPDQIAAVVGEALARTGAVITTGGLGPTSDDRTKESIGRLFGRGMHLDEAHFAWMEERWKKRFSRPLPVTNRQQAMIPDGAEKLENHHGSAPGIWLEDDHGRWVAMLPGVPREMSGMLADVLIPRLVARLAVGGGSNTVVRSLTLRTTGVAESLLADRIESMEGGALGLSLAYLPSISGVDLRLTVRDVPPDDADAALRDAASRLRARLGEWIYGEDVVDLAEVVLSLCREKGFTIGLAESCTGGLLGARLTAIPGSSEVVRGGVVSYHNDLKLELLGVDNATLANHGAVSEEVVRQMAVGARRVSRANIGLAITGIAGPGGGTDQKPVGTVWIAVDIEGVVQVRLLHLWGDREEIRQRAAQWTLEMLRERLRSGS
jgi:nicotinamide-nucleotide amidase